jgi:hypothetical protein
MFSVSPGPILYSLELSYDVLDVAKPALGNVGPLEHATRPNNDTNRTKARNETVINGSSVFLVRIFLIDAARPNTYSICRPTEHLPRKHDS